MPALICLERDATQLEPALTGPDLIRRDTTRPDTTSEGMITTFRDRRNHKKSGRRTSPEPVSVGGGTDRYRKCSGCRGEHWDRPCCPCGLRRLLGHCRAAEANIRSTASTLWYSAPMGVQFVVSLGAASSRITGAQRLSKRSILQPSAQTFPATMHRIASGTLVGAAKHQFVVAHLQLSQRSAAAPDAVKNRARDFRGGSRSEHRGPDRAYRISKSYALSLF